MKINIKPVAIKFNLKANKVELRQGDYILGSEETCRVRALFYNNEDLLDDSQVVIIPQELVEVWLDDQPIIDYVIKELGLVILPPTEIV